MLELKNISYKVKSNNEERYILKNLSLKFDKNKIVVITGQNGSGKTTLLKLIMGIVSPTSGNILLNDKDITNLSIFERANLGIAYSFQQPIKFKGLTVKKLMQIALGKNNAKISTICEYLSKVGLCARDYIDREIDSSLSGGELKRIEIATTLSRNAKINIFDEPEAGIDIWSFDNLINIFQTLKQERKGITIIVSHQEKIMQLADEIILINSANVQKFSVKDDVLKHLKKTYCEKLVEGVYE